MTVMLELLDFLDDHPLLAGVLAAVITGPLWLLWLLLTL